MMPPPGWYADPEQAWTWRWWDGSRWTDLRSPQTTGPTSNPYSFSAWFQQSFDCFKAIVVRVGVFIGLLWGVLALLGWFAVVFVLNSSKGREVRSLLQLDDLAGTGDSASVTLTDAEVDRVIDLTIDILVASIPWMIGFALVTTSAWLWTTALAAIVGHRSGDTDTVVDRSDAAADAIGRVPAVLASFVVIAAITLGALTLLMIPMIVAIAVGGSGVVIALTAVFGFLAGFALMWWLWVRLSLAIVVAAIGEHGIGVRRSWELTDGHFWGVAGRLVIASLIASAVTMPFSLLNGFGFAFGFVTYVALLVVMQAVSTVAAILVSVPSQLVLVRHLTEQHATPLG